jgi:hypothetical protein
MSDITLHADYQDNSVPYVETTRAIFHVGSTELYAYNFKDVVLLNLSQAANLAGKQANSLFDFLVSNTLKTAMANSSTISETSYYTSVRGTKGGKPERIVPVEYVTLYWMDQAYRAKNPVAVRLVAHLVNQNVKTDASIALGIIAAPKLPTKTKAELYRELADLEDKLEQSANDAKKLDNAPGIKAKLAAMPVSGYGKMLAPSEDLLTFNELAGILDEVHGVVIDPNLNAYYSGVLRRIIQSDGNMQVGTTKRKGLNYLGYPASALETLKTIFK